MFSNYKETKKTLSYLKAKPQRTPEGLPLNGTGDARAQLELAKVALIDVMNAEKERNSKDVQYFLNKSYKWARYAIQPRPSEAAALTEQELQQAYSIEIGINHRITKNLSK